MSICQVTLVRLSNLSIQGLAGWPAATGVMGLKNFVPPPDYSHIEIPERPKLPVLLKQPIFPPSMKAPKSQKRLYDMRGPELIHNKLIHKQFGIVAMQAGRMRWGHYEMVRLTLGRRIDTSKMFAMWRIDSPYQPVTKKGQGKRMGGGKGSIDHYVHPIKEGRIIVELAGKCEFKEVKRMLKEVAGKLPFRAKVVSQKIMEEMQAEEEREERENLNPYTFKYCIQNNIQGCRIWLKDVDKIYYGRYV